MIRCWFQTNFSFVRPTYFFAVLTSGNQDNNYPIGMLFFKFRQTAHQLKNKIPGILISVARNGVQENTCAMQKMWKCFSQETESSFMDR